MRAPMMGRILVRIDGSKAVSRVDEGERKSKHRSQALLISCRRRRSPWFVDPAFATIGLAQVKNDALFGHRLCQPVRLGHTNRGRWGLGSGCTA